MKTKCFISKWKLEEQMLLDIFDWIMQFGKIGQIVCIQSHVLLAI